MTSDPTKGPLSKEELQRLSAAKKLLDEKPLSAWDVTTSDVPAGGLQQTRSASTQECAKIAQLLGLTSLGKLDASYRIRSISGGGWRLSGTLSADVVQPCVVTLDPVPGSVDEEFAVEFWRELDDPEGGEDKSILDGADVDPLEGDAIPVGRIVFETLSAGLDPYPRKQGAAIDWQDEKAQASEKSNPFSVLARLKDKS